MRITKEALLKAARESAEKSSRRNRDLVCIYLTGSLLSETPLLGGTTDIDLIYVHTTQPAVAREIVRLTDEVHLDIQHLSQTVFHQPRRLRLDPWIGSYLVEGPLALFDSGHWFEFTQASAGAQFYNPEYVIQRARSLASLARERWMDLSAEEWSADPELTGRYLDCLENAANSLALLNGAPLTERRFMLQFPERMVQLERPELSAALLPLFNGNNIEEHQLKNWFAPWSEALHSAAALSDVPVRLHGDRHAYFERAVETLSGDHPAAALWLMLRTWTEAAACLPAGDTARAAWESAFSELELNGAALEQRCHQLDAYLDRVEETLDEYSQQNGI
jgi:hypothetical protein